MGNKHRKNRSRVPPIAHALGLELREDWSGVDAVMPLLERMKDEGAVVMIKLDGQRGVGHSSPYTAVVTGPMLADTLHIDSRDLEDAIAYVIVEYARRQWGVLGIEA